MWVNWEWLRDCEHEQFNLSSAQINTYVTHPWIFSCSQTGERLKVDKKDVFFPQPWFKFINTEQNGVVSVGRQETHIHYPLKSLKNICMWDIIFMMNRNSEVHDLDIPKSLRLEMEEVFEQSTRSTVDHDNMGENEQEIDDENWIKDDIL